MWPAQVAGYISQVIEEEKDDDDTEAPRSDSGGAEQMPGRETGAGVSV